MTKAKTKYEKPDQERPRRSGPEKGSLPPTLPGGKLGLIVDQLATDTGASTDELASLTGWQRHTVLGALSRLRSRGFEMDLQDRDGKTYYRLPRVEG